MTQRSNTVDIFAGQETANETVRDWKRAAENEKSGEPATKQGTLLGVVIPCMSNILGVLLFLRMPWLVGLAGILQTFLAVLICCITTFLTALSLSAIATNGKVLAGGSYFLISRSLGPAIGTGVGLLFYIANAIGAAMYVIGTVEAFEVAVPDGQLLEKGSVNNIRVTGLVVLGISSTLVALGIKYVARFAGIFLSIVLMVIVMMGIGTLSGPSGGTSWDDSFASIEGDPALEQSFAPTLLNATWLEADGFRSANPDHFSDNWGAQYDAEQYAFSSKLDSFFAVVALWFPACTGIMAGSNRSGELQKPEESIPTGTLTAQLGTSLMYLSFPLLYGACAHRLVLLNDPFFAATSAWPMRHLVIYGVMVSSFGAGLQSLTSATRLLTAIATDGLLDPFLKPFKARPGKEPYPALLAATTICAGAILVGEINAIAPLITMCFLLCYLCVNLSTFLLSMLNSPDWRPSFRYYHRYLSFFGGILCVTLMLVIDWGVALLAFIFAFAIMRYAARQAEGQQGAVCMQYNFRSAKKVLHGLSANHLRLHVITGVSTANRDAEPREVPHPELLDFACQLRQGNGVLLVSGIVGRETLPDARAIRLEATNSALLERGMSDAFAEVVAAGDRTECLRTLLQTGGLGGLHPDTVVVPWMPAKAHAVTFSQMMDSVVEFSKTTIVVKRGETPPPAEGGIDVWWTIQDGGMTVLLAFLLSKDVRWLRSPVRLFCTDQAGASEESREELRANIETLLIDNRSATPAAGGTRSVFAFEDCQRHSAPAGTRLCSGQTDKHQTGLAGNAGLLY